MIQTSKIVVKSHPFSFLFLLGLLAVGLNTLGTHGHLLQNGQLDDEDLSEFLFRPQRDATNRELVDSRGGLFVEDLTWNRCYRIDLDRYVADRNGQQMIHAQVVIGGARGGDFQDGRLAFEVEPQTTYAFSLEMRGTVNQLSVHPVFYRGEAEGYENRDTSARSTLGRVSVGPDWTTFRGTFTTHADSTRAALRLSVYTHERYGLTESPDTYLLIDNVVIEKKLDALTQFAAPPAQGPAPALRVVAAPAAEPPPILDGRLDDPAWAHVSWQEHFQRLDRREPAAVATRFKVLAGPDALWVAVACQEPDPARIRLQVTEDGGPVYSDDSIELFIDTRSVERSLHQFIVNAAGVRQMTWGQGQGRAEPSDYAGWQAAASRSADGWSVELAIPYAQLGIQPQADQVLGLNVCRNRYGNEPKEHSSWSYVAGNFHARERFGRLIFESLQEDLLRLSKEVQESVASESEASDSPAWAELRKSLAQVIRQIQGASDPDEALWQSIHGHLLTLQSQAHFLRLQAHPFVVSPVSPNARFTLPYLPETLSAEPQAIESWAAVNEIESLPIAITNLTDQTETYRVVLFAAEPDGIEQEGLQTESGTPFPQERIRFQQAIAVKDSDQGEPELRFDPLVPMGAARTLSVPPRTSGILWLTLDCRDMQPETYRGHLRVIPLSQPAAMKLKPGAGWVYEGPAQDVPVTLTIRPITLPREPVMPAWLMNAAPNQAFFEHMLEHGHRFFHVSPWWFRGEFNDQGQMVQFDARRAEEVIRDHLRWADEAGMTENLQFLVGFSAYRVFNEQHLKKRFPAGSPAWERAFTDWIRSIETTFEAAGVPHERYIFELWDEPHRPDQEEVLASLRIARTASPRIRMTITLGASRQTPDEILAMAQYADDFCFWGSYWNDAVYVDLIEALRQQGRTIGFYYCDTSLRVDLYRYYRLHAWKAWDRKLDSLGMYKYMTGPGGHFGRASWKTVPAGGMAYNASGVPITSIRLEALREGMDDVRYLKVLEDTLNRIAEARPQAPAVQAARSFLATVPDQVVRLHAHRIDRADQARQQAAELILALEALEASTAR